MERNIKNICEGCHKTFKHPRRSLGMNWGRLLCHRCVRRKNMPLVGFDNKTKYKEELRVTKKKRFYPYLEWSESKKLWGEYKRSGLSDSECKRRINALKFYIRKNHFAYRKPEAKTFTEKFRETVNGSKS